MLPPLPISYSFALSLSFVLRGRPSTYKGLPKDDAAAYCKVRLSGF